MKRLLLLSLALGCLSSAVAHPSTEQRDEATGQDEYVKSVPNDGSVSSGVGSFFPIYGWITPGVTTRSDLKQRGWTAKRGDNTIEVNDMTVWVDPKTNRVCTVWLRYWDYRPPQLPPEWERIGLDWSRSYDECIQWCKQLGYSIEIREQPHTDKKGRFVAEFKAKAPNGKLDIIFDFNGRKFTCGKTASDKSTLSLIEIQTHGVVDAAASAVASPLKGTVDSTSSVSTVSSGVGSFFPIDGWLTLGVTSRSDLQQRRWEAQKYNTDLYYNNIYGDKLSGTYARVDSETDLVCEVRVGLRLPPEWKQIGLSWSPSYDEYLRWFEQLGYSIEITDCPDNVRQSDFNETFEVRAPNEKFTIEFRFKKGASRSEKNTLYDITIRASGVVDAAASVVEFSFGGFRSYAKDYVEQKINEWQKKGRYEKMEEWQARVTEATREAKIRELTAEAEKLFIAEQSKQVVPDVSIVDYDADNEVFMIRDRHFGDLLVPVQAAQAEQFEKGFASMQKSPKYFINDDRLALSELALTDASGHRYTYSNQASLNYAVTNIDYNFDPIEIDVAEQEAEPRGRQTISTVSVSAGKSDVDMNIPAAATRRERSFAVIIANEHYQSEADVEFAARDGEVFAEYCRRTLGLPDAQVRLVTDATLNNMRAQLNWLEQVTRAYEGDADVIFYYAGHGIPDEASKSAYLLPVDGYGSDVETGLKVADLYSRLGAMPARSVSVFLDACFSGARRDGEMLVAARGVAIKARDEVPTGNMVVFTAAQSDETAYPYREKQHGLFTYYLLKKLQESRGVVTFGELGDYISREVSRRSVVVNAKGQTPAVVVAPQLADSWRQIPFGK